MDKGEVDMNDKAIQAYQTIIADTACNIYIRGDALVQLCIDEGFPIRAALVKRLVDRQRAMEELILSMKHNIEQVEEYKLQLENQT